MLKTTLIGKLTAFGGRKNIIVHEQGTDDIIKSMLAAHKIYAPEYDKIAQYFWTGDIKTTCYKIWKFLKDNIKYIIDSENSQKIMSPAAILAYKGNDCKNYSLFTIGILDALKRKGIINNKICYRFASYKVLDEVPHHVFGVIEVGNEEIWIDAVLPTFNNKKSYYHKIDYMPLYSISGVNDQIGLFGSQKRKKEFEKAKVEAKAQGLPEPQKPKSKIVLKIALAPARGPFLLLVGLNFMGLATKLKSAFTTNKDKVNIFWSNLGGNTNELLRKVEQGAKKKRILGDYQEGQQIGLAPAALAAAAAPILLKVGEFLKSIGIEPKEIVEAGKKVIADQAKKVIAKATEKVEALEEQSDNEVKEAVDTLENKQVQTKAQTTNYLPLILIGGAALYFITKKK